MSACSVCQEATHYCWESATNGGGGYQDLTHSSAVLNRGIWSLNIPLFILAVPGLLLIMLFVSLLFEVNNMQVNLTERKQGKGFHTANAIMKESIDCLECHLLIKLITEGRNQTK